MRSQNATSSSCWLRAYAAQWRQRRRNPHESIYLAADLDRAVTQHESFVTASVARVHEATPVADPTWTTPRTADGQPDLQGLWGNKTITPTERPDSAEGRAYLTDEEMAAAHRQRVLSDQAQDDAPAQRTKAGGNTGYYVSALT